MTTTGHKPGSITRFTREIANPRDAGCRAYLIPWSEVRPGERVLIEDAVELAEAVSVYLDDWGDGSQFIRVDISTRHDNGFLGCAEHKGDLLTCVLRKPGTRSPALTEAWAAWMTDPAVADADRCLCRASHFSPHPCTPEHGHPDSRPACPECNGSGLSWLGYEKMPCLAGCAYQPLYWSERGEGSRP